MASTIPRRWLLKVLGGSTAILPLASSTAATGKGMQPLRGELPNEDVPHESVHAFPQEETTRETGQFLVLRNGWAFPDCPSEVQREFFNKTRQTFVYDGQTFVLDSFAEWEPYQEATNRYVFTHADPPKRNGKTFQVSWDTVFTADFDDPCADNAYEEGDRHIAFPFESSYEIVPKRGRG